MRNQLHTSATEVVAEERKVISYIGDRFRGLQNLTNGYVTLVFGPGDEGLRLLPGQILSDFDHVTSEVAVIPDEDGEVIVIN